MYINIDGGYKQAIEAGKKLKLLIGKEDLYCYYSPYKRARETLYGILEGGNLHKQCKVCCLVKHD